MIIIVGLAFVVAGLVMRLASRTQSLVYAHTVGLLQGIGLAILTLNLLNFFDITFL